MDGYRLSHTDLTRVQVFTLVQRQHLTLAEAAERLGLSLRQTRRLSHRFEARGAAGLVHGNRGRRAANRVDDATQARILELRDTDYGACNDSHLQELLAAEHAITISRGSSRRNIQNA